jgi:hypothetical protein
MEAAIECMPMDESFRLNLEAKLNAYREWLRTRSLTGCRWVQYCGIKMLHPIDVPMHEVENRIYELLCEGFYVDWAERGSQLVLRVWEFGGPEPDWDLVFAEQPLRPLPTNIPA